MYKYIHKISSANDNPDSWLNGVNNVIRRK